MRTPTQLRAIKERLQSKLKTVEAGVQRWQDAGRDLSKVARIMAEFAPVTHAGKVTVAEAVLDRGVKAVEAETK